MLADHKDRLSSSNFCLILDSSVGLSAGIQSTGNWVSETFWVQILHSAEGDKLSPFDSKISCLCQSIGINNNKYVCVCMCMYICMHVCTHARTYVRTYVCMDINIHIQCPHMHYFHKALLYRKRKHDNNSDLVRYDRWF